MEWESGQLLTVTTLPLHCNYSMEQQLLDWEQQWLELDQRFLRFEQWRSEGVNNGVWVDCDGDCSRYNYLDDGLLSLCDAIDIDMFPPLPPLYDHPSSIDNTLNPPQHGVSVKLEDVDDARMNVVRRGGVSTKIRAKNWMRTKSDELEFVDVQKYFDRPILEAAKELRIGLTLLKKQCRELGIRRWPHRKLRSLKSLINNVKELGMDMEVSMLEEQRKLLVEQPEMELNQRAKKIRQKSFKANHMRKRKNKATAFVA